MTLKEQLQSDLKDAMKSGNALKRDVLRMLDSAVKNTEIEKRKREEGLTDEEVLEVIAKSVKQRQDSIKQFEEGGRVELAEKEKDELAILTPYLPEQLSEDEIRGIVKEIVSSGANDIGKAMGQAMGRMKGKADGNIVRKIVQEELQ